MFDGNSYLKSVSLMQIYIKSTPHVLENQWETIFCSKKLMILAQRLFTFIQSFAIVVTECHFSRKHFLFFQDMFEKSFFTIKQTLCGIDSVMPTWMNLMVGQPQTIAKQLDYSTFFRKDLLRKPKWLVIYGLDCFLWKIGLQKKKPVV